MRVAVIQMRSGAERAANLARAACLLREAAGQGAELALLPENFSLMATDDAMRRAMAEEYSASTVRHFLCEQARHLQMAIIGGSTLLRASRHDKVRNSSIAVDAHGQVLAVYDKMHLFDVQLEQTCYAESSVVMAGEAPVAVAIDGIKCGLSICYDLRFPELYRQYADKGCNMLCVPAAFTVPTGQAHWEVLLRARAIENQCYVLAAGQWGEHADGRRTWGHSMIIDPWGEVLASLEEGEGVIVADADMDILRRVRESIPALQHRRL